MTVNMLNKKYLLKDENNLILKPLILIAYEIVN